MKIFETEILDLVLTQAMERYMEMTSFEAARQTIVDEWPEQMAALLINFLDRAMYADGVKAFDVIFLDRTNGTSAYITLLRYARH